MTGLNFTPEESRALYRLLAEQTTDVILKTDRDGFIQHASPAFERMGFACDGLLIGPHILDLVNPNFTDAVQSAFAAAIDGRDDGEWVEFLAMARGERERWFEIRVQSLRDDGGEIYGAVSVMRSVEERRVYEERLFAAEMTDPLTGLTNRRAFVAMLGHLVDRGVGGCLAIFDIDHFKSINMQFGQSVGDDVLVVFADFLRTVMRAQDIISRIGGESIGVLLPGAPPDRAEAICARILLSLSEIRQSAGAGSFSVTASAGVARIGNSLDDTIRRAELALFIAKAKGRNRLEMDEAAASA